MVVIKSIEDSIQVKQRILENPELLQVIHNAADVIVECFRNGGKVLFCGNGGSAADAQHIAAELSGRFYYDRDPLDAEALHVNTSYLTAVANDYSYDQIYSRLIKAKGQKGDVLLGISTSGNSSNVIEAFKEARSREMIVISMTGETGGRMKEYSDLLINIPSTDTPRIQESHIMVGHIICQIVEETLFPKES